MYVRWILVANYLSHVMVEGGHVFDYCLDFCLGVVCQVLDGILEYVFHKGFNIRFWDIEFNEFVYEVCGSSYASCDSDEGV